MSKKDVAKIVHDKADSLLEAGDQNDVIHGLLSLLPAGGFLDSLLFKRIRQSARKRLEEFHLNVAKDIKSLGESKVDHDFLASEEFDCLVMKVVAKTVWEYSEQKRKYLRSFLVNTTTVDFSGNPLKETLLALIDEVSPSHIIVLQHVLKGQARTESGWNSMSTLAVNVKTISEPLVDAIVYDLFQKGLIDREYVDHFTNYEVSALGKQLLSFIEEPGKQEPSHNDSIIL